MARISRSSWSSRTNRRSKSSSFSLMNEMMRMNSGRKKNINQTTVTCHQTCNHIFLWVNTMDAVGERNTTRMVGIREGCKGVTLGEPLSGR